MYKTFLDPILDVISEPYGPTIIMLGRITALITRVGADGRDDTKGRSNRAPRHLKRRDP